MIVKIEKREGFFRKYFPLVLEFGLWTGIGRGDVTPDWASKANIATYCGRWTKKGAMKALEEYRTYRKDQHECVYENQNF